jgi:hypothetical protein
MAMHEIYINDLLNHYVSIALQVTADMSAFMGLRNWTTAAPAANTMEQLEQACKDQRKRVQKSQNRRNTGAAAAAVTLY